MISFFNRWFGQGDEQDNDDEQMNKLMPEVHSARDSDSESVDSDVSESELRDVLMPLQHERRHHVVFAIDSSGSMRKDDVDGKQRVEAVLQACKEFLQTLPNEDKLYSCFSLLSFNTRCTEHFLRLTADAAEQQLATITLEAKQGTIYSTGIEGVTKIALNDSQDLNAEGRSHSAVDFWDIPDEEFAIGSSCASRTKNEQRSKNTARQVPCLNQERVRVVFLSDGQNMFGDNSFAMQKVNAALRKLPSLQFHCIGFGSEDFTSLQQLASVTRGTYQSCLRSVKALRVAFSSVSSTITVTSITNADVVHEQNTTHTVEFEPVTCFVEPSRGCANSGWDSGGVKWSRLKMKGWERRKPVFEEVTGRAYVRKRQQPYTQGGMHLVSGMWAWDDDSRNSEPCVMVAKTCKHGSRAVSRSVMSSNLYMANAAVAQYHARLFHNQQMKHGLPDVRIYFLNCYCYVASFGTPKQYVGEEWIAGEFIKWVGNKGYINRTVDESITKLLETFAHFTYQENAGQVMITDLQGVHKIEDNELVLTDPQVVSLKRRYGRGDLGLAGMTAFFRQHTCNDFCRALHLQSVSSHPPDFITQPSLTLHHDSVQIDLHCNAPGTAFIVLSLRENPKIESANLSSTEVQQIALQRHERADNMYARSIILRASHNGKSWGFYGIDCGPLPAGVFDIDIACESIGVLRRLQATPLRIGAVQLPCAPVLSCQSIIESAVSIIQISSSCRVLCSIRRAPPMHLGHFNVCLAIRHDDLYLPTGNDGTIELGSSLSGKFVIEAGSHTRISVFLQAWTFCECALVAQWIPPLDTHHKYEHMMSACIVTAESLVDGSQEVQTVIRKELTLFREACSIIEIGMLRSQDDDMNNLTLSLHSMRQRAVSQCQVGRFYNPAAKDAKFLFSELRETLRTIDLDNNSLAADTIVPRRKLHEAFAFLSLRFKVVERLLEAAELLSRVKDLIAQIGSIQTSCEEQISQTMVLCDRLKKLDMTDSRTIVKSSALAFALAQSEVRKLPSAANVSARNEAREGWVAALKNHVTMLEPHASDEPILVDNCDFYDALAMGNDEILHMQSMLKPIQTFQETCESVCLEEVIALNAVTHQVLEGVLNIDGSSVLLKKSQHNLLDMWWTRNTRFMQHVWKRDDELRSQSSARSDCLAALEHAVVQSQDQLAAELSEVKLILDQQSCRISKPSCDFVQAAAKFSRAAKRELRQHKNELADLEDTIAEAIDAGEPLPSEEVILLRAEREQALKDAQKHAARAAKNEQDARIALFREQAEHFPELATNVQDKIPHELQEIFADRSLALYSDLVIMPSGRHTLYKASFDGQVCALKAFTLADNDASAFFREVSMLSHLQHPRVVALQAAFIDGAAVANGQHAFLQMPWFEHNLEQWVSCQHSTETVRRLLLESFEGLEFIHGKHVVHGDVKPANVLIAHGHAHLADFGISRSQSLSTSRGPGGTLLYMAPEVKNGQPPTQASDMFSAGVMLNVIDVPTTVRMSTVLCQARQTLQNSLCHPDSSLRLSAAAACKHGFFDVGISKEFPAEWSRVPPLKMARVPFPPEHDVSVRWHSMLLTSLHSSRTCTSLRSAHLLGVERIENSFLWNAYLAAGANLREGLSDKGVELQKVFPDVPGQINSLDARVNEVYLYHGSSMIDTILQEGLDPRLSHDRSLYGRGTYFTDRACKAIQYAKPDEYGVQRILVCRVLLGDPFYTSKDQRNLKVPPKRNHMGRRYDSIIAAEGIHVPGRNRPQEHREFVIFERSHAYAEFVVSFRL